MSSITNIGIACFAALLREMITAAIILNTPSVIVYLRQAYAIMGFTEYPREELLWVYNTCSNMAATMKSWKNANKVCEYDELVIFFYCRLHPQDENVKDSR